MNSTLKPTFSPVSPWSRLKSVSWPHPHAEYVCIALQIGRLVGMTGFWHFSCAGPVIIVPSCCFSVGCDLLLGTMPPPPPLPSVVQLADSDTVVLMTHCFAWGHREEFTFFPPLTYSLRSVCMLKAVCQCTSLFGTLIYDTPAWCVIICYSKFCKFERLAIIYYIISHGHITHTFTGYKLVNISLLFIWVPWGPQWSLTCDFDSQCWRWCWQVVDNQL